MIDPIAASLLGAAALAGLMGSPHCLSMCGGFAASVAAGSGTVSAGALAWHAGRLTTYALLGALVASLGRMLPGTGLVAGVLALVLLGWFSLRLAGITPALPGTGGLVHRLAGAFASVGRRVGRVTGPAGRFFFGMATGLLPCGLVWSALAMPMASGSVAWGALTMVAFGLGTLPALGAAAVGFRRLGGASLGARRALAVGVFAAGAWSIAVRTDLLDTLAGRPNSGEPACHDVGTAGPSSE